MNMNRSLFALFLVLFSSHAHALFYAGIRGGVNQHHQELKGSSASALNQKGSNAFYFGGYAGSFLGVVGIDGGVGFQEREFTITGNGEEKEINYGNFLFDTSVRLGFPFLHVGAGGYFSAALPSADQKINGTTTSGYNTLSSVGVTKTDYGLLGSVRAVLSFAVFGISLDARYLHGTVDVSRDPNLDAKTREIQLLLGIQLGT